jgi:23S rRNA (uracil1939-C5)-methyltransferase
VPPEFELQIDKLVYGGDGLGRHKGEVVFVPFTAPGDTVLVRPAAAKSSFLRAEAVAIRKPGSARRSPFCPYYGRCGGCQWQHIEYSQQVETKCAILVELFHHHFSGTQALPITLKACPSPAAYRSRARVQIRGSAAHPTVGFYRHRSHAVQDIVSCPLFLPALNSVLSRARGAMIGGYLSSSTRELELACSDDGATAMAEVEPTGLQGGAAAMDLLMKKAGDFLYASSPMVFFQANDILLPELVATALLGASGGGAALDLYAGVGLFSLPLAKRYRTTVAVEASPLAHKLCVRNAANAGLDNLQAVCADVREWVEATGSVSSPAFDLVLLDPPRTGAGPEVMDRLASWAPETIVYVSCDPQTLIRDLAALPARHYRIDFIRGLDLFPQTYHFETVVRLTRL